MGKRPLIDAQTFRTARIFCDECYFSGIMKVQWRQGKSREKIGFCGAKPETPPLLLSTDGFAVEEPCPDFTLPELAEEAE